MCKPDGIAGEEKLFLIVCFKKKNFGLDLGCDIVASSSSFDYIYTNLRLAPVK